MSNTYLPTIDTTNKGDSSRITVVTVAVLMATLVVAIVLTTRGVVEQQIRADAKNLLATHQQSINSTIERLRHLPTSAARDKDVIALLETGYSRDYALASATAGPTNTYLETIATAADASLFYVIDAYGNTLASSNWKKSNSLVGKNFSFRPYFKEAIQGAEAHYFAIGTTTKEAGYYISQPVVGREGIIGIVVVKTELESLQAQWAKNGDRLILFDEHGVSVLASEQQWRFKILSAEQPANILALREENKYAGKSITLLSDDIDDSRQKLRLDDTPYIINQTSPDARGWQLWHLVPSRSINTSMALAVLTSLLLFGLSAALYLYRREIIRKNRLREAARDADNMRQLNQQLEAEITERILAQQELDAAQTELIHAGKLAALGQMSAAIVHEVNQPLAAIRTFGASAKLLLDRGEIKAVQNNLDEINSLTERLATMTTDLKMFSRKPGAATDRICVQKCIEKVLHLVEPTLTEANVHVSHSLPSEPLYALGAVIRLEQVITNLLTNAVDATKSREKNREIKLHLFVDGEEVVLRVSDNGTGLDKHTIQHLFDPFFTTKPSGEGVGLGLAISYGIVREMGGAIRVRNNEDGGALFSLRLKSADDIASNAQNKSAFAEKDKPLKRKADAIDQASANDTDRTTASKQRQ